MSDLIRKTTGTMGDNSTNKSPRTSAQASRRVSSTMSDLSSALATSESLVDEEDAQRNSHSHVNLGANFSESELKNNASDYETELKEKLPGTPDQNSPPPNYKTSNGHGGFSMEEGSISSLKGDHAVRMNSGKVSQSDVTLRNKTFPKPNRFCALIVRHPKKAMAFTFLAHMMMLLITAVMVRVGYDIIPIEFAQLPLQIQWDEDFLHGMAWTTRNDEANGIINRVVLGNGSQEERSVRTDLIQLFYEEPGGNIFTKTNLKEIKKVEDELYNNTEFQKFCMLFNNICSPPMSVLRYFDGTYKKISAVFNDPDFENIPAVLYTADNNVNLKKQLQMFLGKNHILTDTAASSPITRTFMSTAGPLGGFTNITDRQEDQTKLLEDMMKLELLPICDKHFKSGIGTMHFFYNSGKLFGAMLSKQAMMDMMLAAASLCFIFIFMLIQTQSLWMTGFSLLSILTCFCSANLIYRIVFDFIYFGMFHILAVFIILGIGADDIFVFFDTWKNSAHKSYPSLEHRLSDVYNKAGAAMLFTSLTTAIAFMVSGFSPLLAVNSFGIFSSILVIVNYLSVIIYLPTVVINYHLFWEKWTWPCCRPCKREPASVSVTESPRSTTRKNPVVRFFAGPYYRFLTHKIAKWIVLVMSLGCVACFAYFAARLAPQEEQIKFLKDDSNFGKALDRSSNAFAPSTQDRNVKIYLIWGLKKQDRSACHKTDFKCKGKTVWDESFDLNLPPAQKALLDLCNKLKNGLTSEQKKKLLINEDVVTKALEVDCFIDDLNDFLKLEQQNTAKYLVPTVLTLPMSQTKGNTIMQYNPAHYNMTALSKYFYRYFEVALDYWLYSGYIPQYNRVPHFSSYNKLLGSSMEEGLSLTINTNKDIMYGTRLRYAAIIVNTSQVSTTLGYPAGLPIRDNWEEFIKEEFAKMPASLQGGFMATPTGFNVWHWLKIQKTLADSAILGIVIGICIAYPILILATGNLLVALYAMVTIICITVSVVGVIPMAGWKLGLLESLNLVLVVGLAVDYVVHLAEGYSRSTATNRLGRVHSMLEEVGISVLSGACTTLGASLFMFFAEILFFTQFAIFIFSTIGFSILYALLLFTSVLAIMGPQGEFASIRPWYVALKNKVIGREKGAKDCDDCAGKGFVNPSQENCTN